MNEMYDGENQTAVDEAWKSAELLPETGLVALSDDWAHFKGLPQAMRFPWDKSKGLYVLNGFHNLHCLVRHQTPL